MLIALETEFVIDDAFDGIRCVCVTDANLGCMIVVSRACASFAAAFDRAFDNEYMLAAVALAVEIELDDDWFDEPRGIANVRAGSVGERSCARNGSSRSSSLPPRAPPGENFCFAFAMSATDTATVNGLRIEYRSAIADALSYDEPRPLLAAAVVVANAVDDDGGVVDDVAIGAADANDVAVLTIESRAASVLRR